MWVDRGSICQITVNLCEPTTCKAAREVTKQAEAAENGEDKIEIASIPF